MKIIIIKFLISYLLGSISGAMVIGKIKGLDIRKMGSGNAGGTNAFRIMGPLFALLVLLIDALKGWIAVNYIALFNTSEANSIQIINIESIQIICGICVVFGHVYPIFYQFKGGKGAGTMVGVLAALFPSGLFICFLFWLFTLFLSGYVGLSTIIAGIIFPIATSIFYHNGIFSSFGLFSCIIGVFIIFTHKENIKRMQKGKENKFKKINIFSKNKN